MELFIDPEALKKEYTDRQAWLRKLMNSFASGLNFYLYKHPEVTPRVIHRFEPWKALRFTEGSVGGAIERVNLDQLAAFYGKGSVNDALNRNLSNDEPGEPTGSNGMAIAPRNTASPSMVPIPRQNGTGFFRSMRHRTC